VDSFASPSNNPDTGHHAAGLVLQDMTVEHPVAGIVGDEANLGPLARREHDGIEPLAMAGRLAVASKDAKRVPMQVNRMVSSGLIHQVEHIASATAQDEERIESERSRAAADGHAVYGPRHSTGH